MRWDKQNQLATDQAVTASAVTENSYQKQSAAQDISIGRKLGVLFIVKVAAGASSNWTFEAIQADVTALTTNVEALASSPSYAAAALTVGVQIFVPFPEGSIDRLHLGGRIIPASGGTETITVDAYLVPEDEVPYYKAFPKVVDAEV